MHEAAKKFIAGIITVATVTAFGLHAKDLANLFTKTGSAGQGILRTAMNPPK